MRRGPRKLLLAIAFAAVGVGLLYLPRDEIVRPLAPPEPPNETVEADLVAANVEPPPVGSSERTPAQQAAAGDLRAMSETFRHTTLLIAIRNAGYVCDDVIDVFESADAIAWRARCRDLRAYRIGIDAAGALVVEPTADLWDGLYPSPSIDRGNEPGVPPSPFEPPGR